MSLPHVVRFGYGVIKSDCLRLWGGGLRHVRLPRKSSQMIKGVP
jgi:hypothetical protein